MGAPSTYAELQASVLAWIDDSDANVNVAECIALAEARFNRKLDMPEMEATTTLTAAASTSLPTDLWQVRSLHIEADPRVLLEPVSLAVLRGRYNAQTTGQPQVYAIVGQALIFGPAPDSAYGLSLVYKQSITPLSDAAPTNWLLTKYPDLYVVASLMMAEARGWNDPRASSLKPWWDEIMEEVAEAGRKYKTGGAPVRLRSSVRGAC